MQTSEVDRSHECRVWPAWQCVCCVQCNLQLSPDRGHVTAAAAGRRRGLGAGEAGGRGGGQPRAAAAQPRPGHGAVGGAAGRGTAHPRTAGGEGGALGEVDTRQ